MPDEMQEAVEVRADSGDPFGIRFFEGLPPASTQPVLYLLNDASVVMGDLVDEDGQRLLKSFVAGGSPTNIGLDKIKGWAPAGPRRNIFD